MYSLIVSFFAVAERNKFSFFSGALTFFVTFLCQDKKVKYLEEILNKKVNSDLPKRTLIKKSIQLFLFAAKLKVLQQHLVPASSSNEASHSL
jgi:hypothetical protein